MNTIYKNESFILFNCILIIILFYFLYYAYIFLSKYLYKYKKYNLYNIKIEKFGSNSKRSKMIKIYKGDNILDPDEIIYNSNYNVNDPDSTYGKDPDS